MDKNPKYLKSKIPKILRNKYAAFVLLLFVSIASAQNMETYCCAPPYVMTVVKPNILFAIDVTGSMAWRAAWKVNDGYYEPNKSYYGYFVDTVNYYYKSNTFFPEGHQPGGAIGPFPGNVMNWAVMSRIDVLRKVLSGGNGTPASQFPKTTLHPEGSGSGYRFYLCINVGGTIYKYLFTKPNTTSIRIQRYNWNVSSPDTAVLADTLPLGTYNLNIDIPSAEWMSAGVLRQICDKNLDTDFDEDAPRVALLFFSTSNFDLAREFWESDGPSAVSAEAYINDINNVTVSGSTPVGKAVFDAVCYLSYVDPKYGSFICKGRGHKNDPYYTGSGANLQPVWCRKSFVILLGDGESNSDKTVVTDYSPPLPDGPFARDLCDYDDDNNSGDYGNSSPHHPADDYAYYGHITDIRPDSAQPDMQNVEFYSIFSFGQGDDLFKEIAKDGGFDDKNGDNIPQPEEYDEDGDSIPDHYYDAKDGHDIEEAIMKIIMDIMAKVSSSSGVSVITTGTKAGGTTVQAQFYPRRGFPTGEDLEWIGTCHSLWLDPFGWLREDNVADATLHLQNDYVITMEWDAGEANVMITRYKDVYGNGDSLVPVDTVPVEELMPVWDAGKWLWDHSSNDRTIWTFVNGNKEDFVRSNASLLRPYLGVATDSSADTIIQYIRGTDFTGLRARTADNKVWKLGDVISSGAVAVQSAIERYDFIYGDESYIAYYDSCKHRRQAVYVGANDGMLHCFNGGIPVELPGKLTPLKLDPAGYDLGEELWAYIPYNLLPHLRWLQNPLYCHVYYVDLKTYVTDARIFTPNPVLHPEGWGTILIGGMRLGGMKIVNEVDTCYSAYFAMDVTDPLDPVLMWEFTDPNIGDIGLTACYSTVAKVDSTWYLVFGSGPHTCGGESSQNAKVYVLDLKTGNVLKTWTLPDPQSFVTNIFAADWGMDYSVDRIYFGDCYPTGGGSWGGKIYRILTGDSLGNNPDPDPNQWKLTEVFDMGRSITAEGSIATDDYNHLWLYWGSGRFFSEIDEIDYTPQRYIGIREDTTRATTVAGLFDVTDVHVDTNEVVYYATGDTSGFDALIDTINTIGGWWREFEGQGERNLTTTLVFGGATLFTTFLPTGDICSYGGHGNLYALYYRTGTAYTDPFLLVGDTLYHPIYISVGQGMPSEPSLYVSGDQTKVFIQAGGGIVSPETGIPGLPESGVIIWKGR